MRLAAIINWAYGVTTALGLASGTTMILASDAQDRERSAVAQRYQLDQASSKLDTDIYALTELAREYALSGDSNQITVYRREAAALGAIEDRTGKMRDAGATSAELDALKAAMRWADTLHDEQQSAIAARVRGNKAEALRIVFGAEYERELDRVEALTEQFRYQLDQRTGLEVSTATRVAKLWKSASEIVLGITAFLFIGVLFFVFRRRVLHPVVRLSDVISRLAAQDYAVEPARYEHVDGIGDMANALQVFRENGMERQRLELERDADRSMRDLLSRMTQRMQGCDTTHDLTGVIQRFVPQIAPNFGGRLYLLDVSRGAMVEACSWLGPVYSYPEFSPLACWGLRRGVVHRPAGEHVDVPCDHLDLDGAPGFETICLPLTTQRETLGLLYLEQQKRAPRGHTELSEVYLRMLAENVGLALANLRLRDTLRSLAMLDPLTGLANRRQLDETFETQLAEASRPQRPISCVMLDVDHFKRFNDDFGHDAGDAVLREVGAILKKSVREGCLAFRYGGEEFLLLMPALGPIQARERAEEIRRKIETLRIIHDGKEVGAITASLGLASLPEHCPTEKLIQTADAALFRAKKDGRNRVVVAEVRRIELLPV